MAPKNWTMTTGALLAIIIAYTLWADICYNVVLFSAGLEGVPKEFDEAAAIVIYRRIYEKDKRTYAGGI